MQNKLIFNVFLFFVSAYLFTAQGHLGYNKDGYLRFLLTRNIIEKNALHFDSQKEIQEFRGWMGQGRENRYYVLYAPMQSLLFIPFYIIGDKASKLFPLTDRFKIIKLTCSFLNPILGALLCVVFMLLLSELGYSKKTSLATTIIFGLGTMLWPETRDTYNHIPAVLFILLAFLFVIKSKKKFFLNILLSGLSFGFAFLTREDSILVLPGIFLFIALGLKKKMRLKYFTFLLGLAPAVIIFFIYNYIRFDNILNIAYFKAIQSSLAHPTFLKILIILFSPGKGIFIYNPILIISIFYLRRFYIKNKSLALSFYLILVSFTISLLTSSWYDCSYSWGPRYFLLVPTLLMLSLAEPLQNLNELKKWKRYSIILIIAISIFLQLIAASTFHMKYYAEMSIGKFPFRGILDSFWSLRYSPMARHFFYFFDALRNTLSAKNIGNAPAFNLLDWWWVLGYFRGIKIALLFPLLLIFVGIISYKEVFKSNRIY